MNDLKLTFGIPMYNAEKYIEDLIRCFDFDSDLKYEVLIVDDGSTDSSVEILNKYRNDKLRIISKKNGGVSSARNRIIKEARGEWITFIDADDLIIFEKYIYKFKSIKDGYDEYVICIDNDKDYRYLLKNKDKTIQYIIENDIINSPCQKFYKTDILKKQSIYFDERFSLGEDALFNMKYEYFTKNISFFRDNIYIYRNVNKESLSKKFRNDKIEELMNVNYESLKFCKSISEQKALIKVRVSNCRGCLNDIYKYKDTFTTFSEKIKYVSKIKKYSKSNYIFLNDLKNTMKYWELKSIPTLVMLILVRLKCKKRY